jgi:hypothetical protein
MGIPPAGGLPGLTIGGNGQQSTDDNARRAATISGTTNGPNMPVSVGSEGRSGEQTVQQSHGGQQAIDSQSGDQTQPTPNAAGAQTEAGPVGVSTDRPQGSSHAQPGKIFVPL